MTRSPDEHLRRYMQERLPALAPGIFEGALDIPYYTVDQREKPLEQPASCPSITRCKHFVALLFIAGNISI